MKLSLTIITLLVLALGMSGAGDQPPPARRDNSNRVPQEDYKGTLAGARERRQQLLQTLGRSHPDVVSLDRFIAFYEAFIPLKEKLEQKQAEVLSLENQIQRLVEQRDSGSALPPSAIAPAVEQKLDAILRRLDQMEKRLAELERANRK